MVLIATRNYENARRMHLFIEGPRSFAFSVEHLVELTKSYRPEVIALNVRFGLQAERVVERLPQLLRLAPDCAIVAVTFSPTEDEVFELIALGAYAYVDADKPGAFMRAGEIIACAKKRARLDRMAHRASGGARGALH